LQHDAEASGETEFFPSIKRRIGSFAGLSAGRHREKFTPVEAENQAFCQ
jgi:hypothetical protein